MLFLIIFDLSIMVLGIYNQDQNSQLFIGNIFTTFLNSFSYAIITVILVLETRKYQNYSVFRACFWFISLICYSLLFRSKILELTFNDSNDNYILEFVFFFLKFALIACSFLIEFIRPANRKSNLTYPESTAGLFSWLTFWWITKYSLFILKNKF